MRVKPAKCDNINKIKVIQHSGEQYNLDFIRLAAVFFYRKLFNSLQRKKIKTITIKLLEHIEGGECLDFFDLNTNLYSINIKIERKAAIVDIISTLAHEFIHAHQIVRGDLSNCKVDDWIFKGINYGLAPYDHLTDDEVYDKLPWETEAYDKESSLAKSFFNYYFENTH